jgi:ribosomal protein S12 methylthiotransferase accessory factor
MLYSRTQYQNRGFAKEQQSHYTSVPRPLLAGEPIDWTEVWSLTSNSTRLVPTAFCFFGYPHIDEDPFCVADSNGNAAGGSRLEAILQGLFEVIERDAVGIWWYNRIRRPKVDLQSFDDPYFLQLQDFFYSIGRSLWVLDITNDLNVPTFAAVSGWTDRSPEDVALGFGAHIDARIALNRAIAELNQFAPTLLTKAGSDHRCYPYASPEAVQWFTTARLGELEYLQPNCDLKPRKMTDFPPVTQNSLEELLRSVIENLGRQNMEVCVLDLTRPDINLPVVKVIVPTLRHFWRRLAPGRLYDVPVKLGWRSVPIREEVLNPATIFF